MQNEFDLDHCEHYRDKAGKNVFSFPSVAAFGACMKSRKGFTGRVTNDKRWTGESYAQSTNFCEKGDLSRVPMAEAMLAEIEKAIDLATLRPEWERCTAGAFPSVPDYLANDPEPMRRLRMQNNDSEPIRLMVCTTSSAGISFHDLNRRGCAVLALALALQTVRPVELYTFTAMGCTKGGDGIVKVRLTPSPLCLSEAAYALTSAGYDRNLTHTLGWNFCQFHGGWARDIQPLLNYAERGSDVGREAGARLMAKMGATGRGDILIPPSLMNDPILRNPVAWVLKRLEDYKAAHEEI